MAAAFLFLPPCLQGTTLDNVGGYVNLSEMRTSIDGGPTTKNLRQEYRARWSEHWSEYFKVEAGYHYYSLDQSQADQIGIWRRENTPSLYLTFSHPYLTIVSHAQERRTLGQSSINDLTQKSFEIGMRSRSLKLPVVSVNYYRHHNLGHQAEAGKNIMEQRGTVSIDHSSNNLELRYNFSRAINENRTTSLETTTNSHLFRSTYSDFGPAGRKLGYSATYQITGSSRTDRLPNSETLIHSIPILNALFLDQGDPLIGELVALPQLIDGNRIQPTNPVISIGAGQTGRHIGVDLGTTRSIGALYIYCDKLSDENLQWEVYSSEANFNWQLRDINPDVVFNTIENRYEIIFDTIATQYLKVVNSGFNQVDSVYVTEIEALQWVTSDGEVTQSNISHLVSLSGVYRISERVNLYSDVTYHREPSVGLVGRRDDIFATSRLNHKLSEITTHSLVFQQNYQMYQGIVADISDRSIQYNLRYDPLATLGMSWSALGRISDYDHSRNSENLVFSWRGSGEPV
ncbi:MAG: hypothetical protein P1R58_13000, partial [bacterium]|nr:hypothetical protein [bacterium]